ncbi:MAG: biotin--[Clostridia bacterium]|nr:biotin--[acetyl-CoA-carboxylase] ligase [Clostridia bacterium]
MKQSPLNEEAIRHHLPPELSALPVLVFPELASTNDTARELARQGAPDGLVVIADHQTGGRGRRGRSFFSPPGVGLYLTMIFRTTLPAEQAVQITTLASLAAARAMDEAAGTCTQIKWINDIYLNGHKLCGILADGAPNGNGGFDYMVVGIGINVNTPADAFPPELRASAGSLYSETGRMTDRNRLAALLIAHLLRCRDGLTQNLPQHMAEYRRRSCVLGEKIRVYGGGCDGAPGTAVDIDDNGHLLVQMDTGEYRSLNSGEITIRITA